MASRRPPGTGRLASLTALVSRRPAGPGVNGTDSGDDSTPRSGGSGGSGVAAASGAGQAPPRFPVSTLIISMTDDTLSAAAAYRRDVSGGGAAPHQESQEAGGRPAAAVAGAGAGAGSGPPAAGPPSSRLQAPVGVAADFCGNAYIADTGHCRILRVALDSGASVVLAGGAGYGFRDGPGHKARFACPMYLALDPRDCSLVVTDQHCIRRVAADGTVTTVAGSTAAGHVDGPACQARFYNLRGVAVDGEGNIYTADSSNHCVRLVAAADSMVSTLAGCPGAPGFRDACGREAKFRNPCGVAIDPQDGFVVVADAENNRLRKVDRSGVVTTIVGTGVAGFRDDVAHAAHLNHPQGVAVDGDGSVVVADLDNHRVRLVTPSGGVLTLAGSGTAGDRDDEQGLAAAFFDPHGIAISCTGDVLVTEGSTNKVRLIRARLHSPHNFLVVAKSTFTADLAALLASGDGADVTFTVGGERLRAHRWMVAARCECFGRMLGSELSEGRTANIEIRDCTSAHAFREFLRYLYTDALDFRGDCVLDVLLLGRKYMVGRLFQHCCAQVRRGLCCANAMGLLAWAEAHRVEELRPMLFRYVLQHLRAILARYPATIKQLESKPDLLMQLLQHAVEQPAAGGAGGGGSGGNSGGKG